MAKPGSEVPRKPLIFADSPFDGMDAELSNVRDNWDPSYVEGYSEQRRDNELLVRDGKEPVPMDRLQWVRISKGGGENISETDDAMHNWRRLGYRAAGLDYLESQGYPVPATSYVAADGTIRRGDLALFYAPERQAARNKADDAADRAIVPDNELKSTHAGLEVIENTKAVKRNVSPREVLESDLPQL